MTDILSKSWEYLLEIPEGFLGIPDDKQLIALEVLHLYGEYSQDANVNFIIQDFENIFDKHFGVFQKGNPDLRETFLELPEEKVLLALAVLDKYKNWKDLEVLECGDLIHQHQDIILGTLIRKIASICDGKSRSNPSSVQHI
jgi:hypothetical protein